MNPFAPFFLIFYATRERRDHARVGFKVVGIVIRGGGSGTIGCLAK